MSEKSEDMNIQSFCDVTPVHWAVISRHFEAKTSFCLKLSKVLCDYSILEDGTTMLPRKVRTVCSTMWPNIAERYPHL